MSEGLLTPSWSAIINGSYNAKKLIKWVFPAVSNY